MRVIWSSRNKKGEHLRKNTKNMVLRNKKTFFPESALMDRSLRYKLAGGLVESRTVFCRPV